MSNTNKIFLGGNLTRDPELKYIPSGAAVCVFTVASSRNFKKEDGEWGEETTFATCETWAGNAERFAEKHKKGDHVCIEGSLRCDEWTNKEGEKRSKMKIRVNRWEAYNKSTKSQPQEEAVNETPSDEPETVVAENGKTPF